MPNIDCDMSFPSCVCGPNLHAFHLQQLKLYEQYQTDLNESQSKHKACIEDERKKLHEVVDDLAASRKECTSVRCELENERKVSVELRHEIQQQSLQLEYVVKREQELHVRFLPGLILI
jgi:hypothetical protein